MVFSGSNRTGQHNPYKNKKRTFESMSEEDTNDEADRPSLSERLRPRSRKRRSILQTLKYLFIGYIGHLMGAVHDAHVEYRVEQQLEGRPDETEKPEPQSFTPTTAVATPSAGTVVATGASATAELVEED